MKRKGLTNAQLRERGLKIANPERVAADLETRRSNAARPVPSHKVRRQMSRAASRAAAVRDYA